MNTNPSAGSRESIVRALIGEREEAGVDKEREEWDGWAGGDQMRV